MSQRKLRNIVTTSNPDAARNCGLEDRMARDPGSGHVFPSLPNA